MKPTLFPLLAMAAAIPALPLAGEEKPKPDQPVKPAKFKSMQVASCVAGNRKPDPSAIGGYGPSKNFPIPLPKGAVPQRNELHIEITDRNDARFRDEFQGLEIRLVNGAKKTAAIKAADSRLYLVQEAKNEKGEWIPIEFEPRTFCGNSFHRVYLEPGQFWSFTVPNYSGPVKAELRFKLTVDDKTSIVSESYEGSIHPGQFIAPPDPLAIPNEKPVKG